MRKVTLCHVGDEGNKKTIRVGPKAAAAHLRQHDRGALGRDTLGPCVDGD